MRINTIIRLAEKPARPIMNIHKISITHSSMQYVTYFVNVHDRPLVAIGEPYRLAKAQQLDTALSC